MTFVDPRLVAEPRNDDHPLGDPRAGQQFIQGLFSAFVRSPHWERGLFVLVYDEWGGFFDHVAPPHFQDDRANADDLLDFSQAGFRVPAIFASPRVLPGAVDHAAYEHSAVARFLEWRFLGAPPRGSTISARWSLTKRDRFSRNPGELISSQYFDPEVYFNLDMSLDDASAPCGTPVAARAALAPEVSAWKAGLDNGYWESVGVKPLLTSTAH